MKLCLIVDDSSVIRKVANTILTGLDYKVVEAENGQKAIEHCEAQMPDAILLDWHMPVMNGQDFLTIFKRTFPTTDLPWTIYATTQNDPIDISRALSSGATDYIIKPFNRDDLEKKFAKLENTKLGK